MSEISKMNNDDAKPSPIKAALIFSSIDDYFRIAREPGLMDERLSRHASRLVVTDFHVSNDFPSAAIRARDWARTTSMDSGRIHLSRVKSTAALESIGAVRRAPGQKSAMRYS